jgi:septum formation protein
MPGDVASHGRSRPDPAFIYLASQSPRRRQLLEQIGVRFELLLPREDEDAEALEAERLGELPFIYVNRVTRAKVRAARRRLKVSGLQEAPILCSDTTVALGRRILGKPRDPADAVSILSLLSNRTHRVITAVAVCQGRHVHVAVSTSHVRFAKLSTADIETYVASGEPFGKAGAYAIQSNAAAWISHIEGSYSGIMGLPLFETAQLLRRCGVLAQTPSA